MRARVGAGTAAALAALLVGLPACTAGGEGEASGGADPAPAGRVTVLAAASLTDVFAEIGAELERAHPDLEVAFSFAASSTLARQVADGAPADVLATASDPAIRQVVEDGLVREATPFAGNRLQIAVPAGNPAGITGLADFTRPELTLAVCAEQVPCGAAAVALFAAAGITAAPDTYEHDVRAALAKAGLGEVDAALVYHTDVLAAAGEVDGVEVREAAETATTYPIGVVENAPNPAAAEAFVEHVLSAEGQAVLRAAGFDAPPET